VTSAGDVAAMLAGQPDAATRTLYFSAMLAAEAGHLDIVVVGGSAIEIYTEGAYVSGDIDLVGPPEALARTLTGWGFEHESRVWFHRAWGLTLDLVGPRYNGRADRTQRVETPYGPVRLAGPEDLIVKRMISAAYWKIPDDFNQAVLLAIRHRDLIDWAYLEEQARRELVSQLLPQLRERMGAVSVTGTPRTR
jgi:hypothetical protein